MKTKLLLSLLLTNFLGFAQTKTTGNVVLNSGLTIKLDLNNTTSTATLTTVSASGSWFGFGWGAPGIPVDQGMTVGTDCIVLRSATNFSDSKFTGNNNPTVDGTQNWTVVSNTVNTVAATRTIVATRPLNTGDANDFVFDYAATAIDFVFAAPSSGNFSVSYHGSSNRGHASANFTTLGVEDFSLNATSIFPNPSTGEFKIQTKTNLDQINVYSQTGQFVKTIDVTDKSNNLDINVKGLSTGIYLIELRNETEKSWKKVIIE